jgi:glycosyltransferase involved in cell wall biosynthesis
MSSPVTSNPPPATTTPFLSVVIPACNPGMRHFQIVLEALRDQTLAKDRWELIVVDDASRVPLKAAKRDEVSSLQSSVGSEAKNEQTKNEEAQEAEQKSGGSLVASGETEEEQRTSSTKNEALIDLSWHPNAKLVQTDAEREGVGLVSARLRGFELGRGDVFVFVDQDNALRPDYLQGVADIAVEYPHIGTWGGQILLKFDEPERAPAAWLRPDLCTRELTQDVWSNVINHHDSTPWGAGLCARREVLEAYRRRVLVNPMRRLLDPTPRKAGFGGDSDLAYAGCVLGYGKGAFKRLVLDHLIPVGRCSPEYFVRLAESKGYSEILHGYVEEGRTQRPRNDWKYHLMQFLRAPFEDSLRRTVKNAYRKGQWTAVAELSSRPEELRDYAMKLQRKAERLTEAKS